MAEDVIRGRRMVGASRMDRQFGGHVRWSLWPWPRPLARPLQPELYYPPQKKNPWGSWGGIRSPSYTQEEDSPQEQEALLRLCSVAEVHSGYDVMSGALTGSLSNHFRDRRGRCWEWPPEPPTPDESPWTRQDGLKLFMWARKDLKNHVSWEHGTALLAVIGEPDPLERALG